MARNETVIEASQDEVWTVLATPSSYGEWVVGSSDIRDADDCWPDVGCRFYHRVGTGPLKLSDYTEVLASKPARRLRLRAKARPLGVAEVSLELHPHARGTRVVMVENAGNLLTRLVFNPLTHLLVRGRNVESLRRLKHIVESTTRHRQRARAA